MRKILIVNGSKRRKGNSYALESRIAEQLQGKAEVTTFNIGEKDVRVCLACDEGTGEWFDLSKKPIERASFTFGGAEKKTEGYYITGACIGCGSCTEVCPQNCIVADSIPHVIRQEHCLHCGNCASVCPVSAVERR